MTQEQSYNLKKSKAALAPLYPVLEDAHGQVFDGMHRLAADPDWPRRRVEEIKTRKQFLVARIVANSQRRRVSKSEREQEFILLAMELKDEGFEPGEIAPEIIKLTGFSERYVRDLLPDKYKRSYTPPDKTALSAEYEDLAKIVVAEDASTPEATLGPSEDTTQEVVPPGPELTGTLEAPATSAKVELKEEPEFTVQDFITDTYRRFPGVDEDFLLKALNSKYGLSRRDARDEIRQYKGRGRPSSPSAEVIPRAKSTAYKPPQPPTTRCPLCGRDGADKNLILSHIEDPEAAQTTLVHFITEAVGR